MSSMATMCAYMAPVGFTQRRRISAMQARARAELAQHEGPERRADLRERLRQGHHVVDIPRLDHSLDAALQSASTGAALGADMWTVLREHPQQHLRRVRHVVVLRREA